MVDELEWQTRRDRVNKRLKALNPPWTIPKYRQGLNTSRLDGQAVEEYPTANGPADYALFVKGKLLGIIEAKKVGVGPQNVLEQAKRYSKGAFEGPGNWDHHRVPFLYASYGEVIYFIREDFEDDKPFDPKVLPAAYLTCPQVAHTFVYVSTIQRMVINLFGREAAPSQTESDPNVEEEAERLDIPIHAFDLIIDDECHRGYTASETAVWRNVLDYFDAIKIGLTATPAPHARPPLPLPVPV